MDIYEAIYSRRSVRDFKEKEIDMDIVKRILDAGLRTPSNNHMREWEFIIVNNKATRLKLIDKIHRDATIEDMANLLDSWGPLTRFSAKRILMPYQNNTICF